MPETYGLSPLKYLERTQGETIEIQTAFLKEFGESLVKAAEATASRIKSGGKLLIIGNGGSAADAQHIAAEMIGRMLVERPPLPAIALTTDSSNLTAVGNDYGYDQVFLRQVKGLCRPNDVLLAISTSGNSQNVLLATEEAKRIGAYTVALTGGSGGKLANLCDVSLVARLGKSSSRIQETHIFALHSYVDLMDRYFLDL